MLWLYQLIQTNLVIAVLTLIASFALIFCLVKTKNSLTIVTFIVLVLAQFTNFSLIELTEHTNDEQRVQSERLSMYPPDKLQLGYYFEQKQETIVVRRIANAFIEQTDLNLYFFSGHPRPRIGVDEFEKFPYVLLPIFLFGIYKLTSKNKTFLICFMSAVFISSVNSDKSALGFFILFPFFLATIYTGFLSFIKLVNKFRFSKYLYLSFVVVYLLVLLQIISYEVF